MPKPGKLQKIISNATLKDDLVIAVGDDSFTVGELRAMDAESDGSTTKALEAREAALVSAQSALATTLQQVADKVGVPIDSLIDGKLDDIKPRTTTTATTESDDPLSEIDPKVLSALEKRFGVSAVNSALDKVKTELADTRKALGIALKVNMDDYYQQNWKELSTRLPKGVDLKLDQVLKYADEQGLRDKTGRYNVYKAFDDLTLAARHKADIEEAERRGEERAEQKRQADAARPGGALRQQHLKPPVDDKGRTHSIEHQLNEALNDTEIQRMLNGVPAAGVQ